MSDIILYGLSTCVHCQKTGELLEELLGASGYEHIYADRLFGEKRNNVMSTLRRINPTMSFPTVVIGEEVVVGFKEDRIRKLLGERPAASGE